MVAYPYMIKAVIFDFDGVIHDTFETAYGFGHQLGFLPDKEAYRKLFDGNLLKNLPATEEQKKEFKKLKTAAFKKFKIEEEIKEELIKFAEEFELYIISSNLEELLTIYFSNNSIPHLFREILGAETHYSKEEKFKMLFEKHGFNKDECVFITDTLGDLKEGNAIGVKSIAVDFGFHERERLEKGNPFTIVSHFSELLPLVKKIR